MSPRNESDDQIGLPAPNPQEWDEDEVVEEDNEIEYLEGSEFTKIEILRFLVSLKDFVDRNENRSETTLCEIWDSIQTCSVATCYHENGLFDIIQHIFEQINEFEERDRLLELLIGIMGNMLLHLENIDGSLENVLSYLAVFCEEETDVCILAQTMRALSTIFKRFPDFYSHDSSLIPKFRKSVHEIISQCKNEEAISYALKVLEHNADEFLDQDGKQALWTFLKHFHEHEIEEIMNLADHHFLNKILMLLSEVVYEAKEIKEEHVEIINHFWDSCNKEIAENKEEFSCLEEPWQFLTTILYLARVTLSKCNEFTITTADLKRTFTTWKLLRRSTINVSDDC
ncbi:unnamed protein product, partial [Oikopleura dioica]